MDNTASERLSIFPAFRFLPLRCSRRSHRTLELEAPMLPLSRSLLTPTPIRAMAVRPPPRPPNCGRPSFPGPSACGAVARTAPSLSIATVVSSP
ncbi:hypothetical protein GUJ93_ZPchr0008g11790 [Zizania palustris]|uniref:Uncharacterized protein n=1 Tax=Zizania palustris TaxID=103762 RepID=A0A8J5QZM5_ZIZPA|nr:hypothetical protein GUJ93_ZPchr0008g11790 [Zizania palustris]